MERIVRIRTTRACPFLLVDGSDVALTCQCRERKRWGSPTFPVSQAPLVNAFGVWLDEQRSRVSPRSRLGEKLTYIANQWDGLLVFLYDGRVEMDSNFVENRIRPIKTMESFCNPCSSI